MSIRATDVRVTRLDADGCPTGPAADLGSAFATFDIDDDQVSSEELELIQTALTKPRVISIEVTTLDPGTAYLLFRSRRVFGYPRPLAINGREYRRRVRRR